MDTHSSQLTAPLRSRNSQTPSPSHSASASATSSIRKRKLAPDDHMPPFPSSFSDTRDGALTSNDDLESISVRGADSDSEDQSEEVVDEEEYDDSSMRNFTTSRLENSGPTAVAARNSKLKTENLVKVEPADVTKDGGTNNNSIAGNSGAPGATGLVSGIVVKEDTAKSIFTENIQTSGAYTSREESLKREEQTGKLKFVCVSNDDIDEHMVWLIGLKNIFARQLPNMPREYIVRLIMDRNHKSVMVIRRNQVVGGITYRPYISQRFGEIAFCAITADEQVKGYGTRLMNHLKQHARDVDDLTHFLTYADNNAVGYFVKQHARDVDDLTHFLTYADNNAVGYFVKQGFTKEIYMERERWHGSELRNFITWGQHYIKDYDGGILMECKIDPKLPYTNLSTMIHRQRQAIDEKIRELSNCHIVYSGIDFQKKEAGIPKKTIKVEDIPGLREAGWTPDQYGYSRFKTITLPSDGASHQKSLVAFMRSLLKAMHDHPDAWPFKEPVDARDVPDYYDIIKDPMDLKTLSKRVESEQYYVTLDMFVADVRRMFANARTYNSPDTIYYKCSTRLEAHFSNKVQAGLQSSIKIQP